MKILIRSILLIQALLLLNFYNINAQTFSWAKSPVASMGIVGSHISIDAKGNSFVTGYSLGKVTFDTLQYTGYDGIDIFLAKYDANGNCKWAKHAGGNYPDHDPWGDYGRGTSIDAKGNCYVTGYFEGEAFFDTIKLTPSSWEDIFIAKYDSNGNCLWAKNAGVSERNHGFGISVDPIGNSYITGSFTDSITFGKIKLTSYGAEDIFIAKYDTYGNCLWAKHAGGAANDAGNDISIDANGNLFITGLAAGTTTFDTLHLTSVGGFVAKYDTSGNCLWVNTCGNMANSISADPKGNSYVTGEFWNDALFGTIQLTGYGGFDIFIAKYDTYGNCLWTKDGGGSDWDIGYGISIDKKGNSYVTGYFTGIASFDSVKVTSSSQNNVFIAKYDSIGNCLWVKQAGGTEGAIGYSVANDENGNIYSTGWFQQNATFDTIQLYGTAYIAKILDNTTTNVFNVSNELPNKFSLSQNYPNPFNPSTVISFSLPSGSNVKLIVYNTLGQTIKVLENGFKNAGIHYINFNASNFPSGIYFYRLETGQFSQIKKMMLLK